MNNTPITILRKQIKLYHSIIEILKGKEGIDYTTTLNNNRINTLIKKANEKIVEFESAIVTLEDTSVTNNVTNSVSKQKGTVKKGKRHTM
jgi:hypothetical protein